MSLEINPITTAAGIGVVIEGTKLISEAIENHAQNMPKEILTGAMTEPLIQLGKRSRLKMVARQNYEEEINQVVRPERNPRIIIDSKTLKKEGSKPSPLASISLSGAIEEWQVPSGMYPFYSRDQENDGKVVGFYVGGDSVEPKHKWLLYLGNKQSSLNRINPVVMTDGQVVYSAKPKSKYFNAETPSSAIYIDQVPMPTGPISFSCSRFGKTQNGIAYMIAYPEDQKDILSCFLIDTKMDKLDTSIKNGFERFNLDMDKILESSGLSKAETIRATPWFTKNSIHWLIEISTHNEKRPETIDRRIVIASINKTGDIKYQNLSDLLESNGSKIKKGEEIKIVDIVEYKEDKRIKRLFVGLITSQNKGKSRFLLLDEEGKALVVDKEIVGDFIKDVWPIQTNILDQGINWIIISNDTSKQKVAIPKISSNSISIL